MILKRETELSIKEDKQQEIKYKLDYVLEPYEGHPIFEVDLFNKIIRVAELEHLDTLHLFNWKQQLKEQSILKKEGCIYLSSLNIQNLKRKYTEFKDFNFLKKEDKVFVNKNRTVKLLK